MRILLTNHILDPLAGSELYVHDVAQTLLERGHTPIVYSPVLGDAADMIRRHGIAVVDDLNQIAAAPDLIHAQHHLSTMAALSHFRATPAVYVCHGWLPWIETPPRHPCILHYVIVSEILWERLISENGIPREAITHIPNFVDLTRFQPRAGLNARPQRALLFCNHASDYNFGAVVRRACEQSGIPLDIVGLSNGNPIRQPEAILHDYDLIFARGRAAMESIATGAAVILVGPEGAGELMMTTNWEWNFRHNFGLRALSKPVTEAWLTAQISRYDAEDARRLSALFRGIASRDAAVDQLEAVYTRALNAWAVTKPDAEAESRATADYLAWLARSAPNRLSRELAEVQTRFEVLQGERDMLAAHVDGLNAHVDGLKRQLDILTAQNSELAQKADTLLAEQRVPLPAKLYRALMPLPIRLKLRDLRHRVLSR